MPPKKKTPSIDTLGERESLPKSVALGGTAACRADLGPLTAKLLEQQREIGRLTAERDEARREVCKWECRCRPMSERDYASSRKWDCFPPRKMFEGITP